MSVRSLGVLAARRRADGEAVAPHPHATGGPGATGLTAIEQAVPTEIITFYTAVIAACEAVLARNASSTFAAFRFVVYLVTLGVTAYAVRRSMRPSVPVLSDVVSSPEWLTAVIAFAAWGAVLPGSFLYEWLDADALTISVTTIAAAAGLLLGGVLTPKLRGPQPPPPPRAQRAPAPPAVTLGTAIFGEPARRGAAAPAAGPHAVAPAVPPMHPVPPASPAGATRLEGIVLPDPAARPPVPPQS